MGGEAWWATVHGVAKSQHTEWLSAGKKRRLPRIYLGEIDMYKRGQAERKREDERGDGRVKERKEKKRKWTGGGEWFRDPRAYWSPGNPKAAPPAPWAPSSDLQVGLWDLQRSEGPAFPPFLNPRDREVLTGGAAPGPRVQPSSGSHEGVAPTSPCPGVKRAAKRAGTGAVGVGGRCPMVLPTLSLPPGTLPPWDAPSHY